MAVEQNVRAFLLADAAIAALVTSSDGKTQRVFPGWIPAKGRPFPCIVYSRISRGSPVSLRAPSGLVRVMLQIDAWAATYSQAKDLADMIRRRLDGYRGAAAGASVPGAFLGNERDTFEPDADAYRVSQDWQVWNEEV